MSRDPYRSSTGDLGYAARPAQRWDAERVVDERDRSGGREMVRIEERERDVGPGRVREHSAGTDEFFERRAPHHERHGQDFVREREVYREEPRVLPVRSRRQSVTVDREREVEREREYYKSPSPPPVRRVVRPAMLRRRSSLDTFDRKPTFPRYVEREEYGPPVVRRRYEEELRAYPERVRETEIIRRRRSRSRSSSFSSSSSSSSSDAASVRTRTSEFPKRGRTRMPARLVSKRAIIDLGYPFEEEVRFLRLYVPHEPNETQGEVIIIQKALGRENIDEVLRLSEKYKSETSTSALPSPLSPHPVPPS